MTTPTPPTATSAPPAQAAISRLHPFDGLFLRAEHLNRMQEYTRELTRALGQAGGPGVVYGYGVHVRDGVLEVSPGLAIDPSGRPLLMTTSLEHSLKDLQDGLWVIELVGADVPFGDEEIYGALCDDPCSGGTSTRPYIGEPVALRLREEHLNGIAGPERERRSRVASTWFELERLTAAALLPTSERDAPKRADFSCASWNEPTGPPVGDAVPIGVLLKVCGEWEVDAWIARRDRIEIPPRRSWQQRLGMRPLDVFIAQVLQFQVHLACRWSYAAAALVGLANAHLAVSKLDEAAEELRHRRTRIASELVAAASSALRGTLGVGSPGRGLLTEAGFYELPPAGYLPLSEGCSEPADEVQKMFGPQVTLRFCACRPDYVAHAVEEAQHLDRIPLTASRPPKPQVDVLVPDGAWTGGKLTTPHNWVAFHRHRSRDCPAERETVEVYLQRADDVAGVIQNLQPGGPRLTPAGHVTATFAADPMAFPAPDAPPQIADWVRGASKVTLIAQAATPGRRPLAGHRAAALIPLLNSPVPVTGPTTFAATAPEAIHIIVPPLVNVTS